MADGPWSQFSQEPWKQFQSTAEPTFAEDHPTLTGIAKGAGKWLADTAESALSLVGEATGTTGGGLAAKEEDVKASVEGVKEVGESVKKAAQRPVETVKEAFSTPEKATESTLNIASALVPALDAEKLAAGARALVRPLAPAAEKLAARGEAKVAAATEGAAEKNQLIADLKKLKMRLTPQQAGGAGGRMAASIAGRPQLERELSLHNARQAKAAAASDVGITGELSRGAVTRGIDETLSAYKAPRALGRVNLETDAEWQKALKEVHGTSAQEAVDFPEDFNEKLEKEITKWNKPSADADTLVTKIAKLRERAGDNFRAGGADDKELARAQRKIATAMEEAIERHGIAAGKGDVITKFREARVRLAKLYTVRDALTESGELDLGELEKRLDRGEPLTGNLRTLARARSSFDRSFQNVEKIREHPVGALDVVLGGMAGAGKIAAAGASGAAIAPVAAAVAARPATRAILGSRPYQALAIGPKVPKAGLVTRAARKVANTLKSTEEIKRRRHTLESLEAQE